MGGVGSGRRKGLGEDVPTSGVVASGSSTTIGPAAAPAKVWRVRTPSGSELQVRNDDEKKYYDSRKVLYVKENQFETTTDKVDLDNVLFLELLLWRWQTWLSQGRDYDLSILSASQEEQYRRNIHDTQKLLLEAKTKLGMTREARLDKTATAHDFIQNLLRRAHGFKLSRDAQGERAVTLFRELQSIVRTFDRSNENERRVVGIESEEDIVDWLRNEAFAKFDEIDIEYRKEQAKWAGAPEAPERV